jgi:Transposase DDE domain
MFTRNTITAYPIMLIVSIKKSFEALGEKIGKTGRTISRWLRSASEYYDQIMIIAHNNFAGKKELILIFDDTLIKKIHSKLIQGCGLFFDTKICRRIMAHKLLVAMLTDGKIALPLCGTFLFPKELLPEPKETKYEWMQRIILAIVKGFPKTKIIVTADGAFASKEFLRWCVKNTIATEVRMRSNCVVWIKGKKIALRDIQHIRPKGRQTARTIAVLWHNIPLFITAQRRTDKHNKESIIFQAATYSAKPCNHVKIYRIRWNIEKFFRTSKQHLGLQNCSSRKIETHRSHVASVLLAYALIQCDQQKQKLPTPEAAIRAAERKNNKGLLAYFDRLDQYIRPINA